MHVDDDEKAEADDRLDKTKNTQYSLIPGLDFYDEFSELTEVERFQMYPWFSEQNGKSERNVLSPLHKKEFKNFSIAWFAK